jgi:RNA 2',3'-cyclic 3'-phosphodiesterase
VRLFVAVTPPAEVLDLVARVHRPERQGVRWTTRDQWHVTLRFLGEIADPAPVEAALRSVAWPAATMVLGPEVAPLGRRVLVLPVAGLDVLAALAREVTAQVGGREDRPFVGHLTLARCRTGSAGALAGERCAGRAPVTTVSLFRSRLRSDGARYEELASIPVQGA